MKRKVNNSHYTLETRKLIEIFLDENKTITEISKKLNRDRSNIAKEVNKHKKIYYSEYGKKHPCANYSTCTVKSYECYKSCKKREISLCEKLISSPHVCNGCSSKQYCKSAIYYYKAIEAEMEYQNELSNNRKGLRYTEYELKILNTDVKALAISTQSLNHSITVINERGFSFKLRTVYKQIEKKQVEINKNDLLRPRKVKKDESINNKVYKKKFMIGHTYENYLEYKESHPTAIEMQMDTVEGTKETDEPSILTLQIVEIKFLFMFRINKNSSSEVINTLIKFKEILTDETFNNISEILLTDNGSEFSNLEAFKINFQNTNVFYCHPYSSFEKGSIENNHELIRRVISKNISLKVYSQQDLNTLCSNINSLIREELGNKCPFDLIDKYISLEKLERIGVRKINGDKVILIPKLLGDKNIDNIEKYLDVKEIKKRNIKLLK